MKLSIILPFYNEAASISVLFSTLWDVLEGVDAEAEIICVDDGSRDETHARLMEEKHMREGVKVLRLSRNFGKEAALMAGLDIAAGDAVMFMDSDLQHPPAMIPVFLEHLKSGVDIVYGVRKTRKTDGRLRAGLSGVFYKLLSGISKVDIPVGAGDFRILSRRAVEALKALPERRRFLKGLYAWIGFNQIGVPYDVEPRHAGASKWSLRQLFGYGLGGLVSFSNTPLRMMTLAGFIIALGSTVYALVIFFEALFIGKDTPGFATLATAIFFFGGVQLLCIGIVGEYIGQIFDETKARPSYIIESIDD